ncbi:MAG: hypothetical protein C0475_00915 [Planctomyces sp.]|nr:hypothetical protein [Planctomyces sp.]
MCTLSVVSSPADAPHCLWRAVFARDELRSRPPSGTPRLHSGPARALYPIDAAGGGTWLAATEHGLLLALLNQNPRPGPAGAGPQRAAGGRSRGTIIPALTGAQSLAEAQRALGALDPAGLAPFRLVALDGSGVVVASWTGRSYRVRRAGGRDGLFMVCSSGLGDHVVRPHRHRLLERTLARLGPTARAQDAFHATHDPARGQLSPMMARRDARTVSVCLVEREPSRFVLRFRLVQGDAQLGDEHRSELATHGSPARGAQARGAEARDIQARAALPTGAAGAARSLAAWPGRDA